MGHDGDFINSFTKQQLSGILDSSETMLIKSDNESKNCRAFKG